jgi:hypothetical protein
LDRRVFYAVLFLTGMRHGEAARLCWENYDASCAPLGKLILLKTKTEVERQVPVLVPLPGILAEWKLSGWPQLMGRKPEPGDLIVPSPAGRRTPLGKERSDHDTYKRLLGDLWVRKWRPRRVHDTRRTFISLSRKAGADKDVLRRATHGLPGRDVLELYTSVEWETLCEEVGKLRVHRREALALAAGADAFADPSYAAYRQHTNVRRNELRRGKRKGGPSL